MADCQYVWGDTGLEQGRLDELTQTRALALLQGGEHAHGEQDAGRDVGDRRADLHGRAAGRFAGNAHQTAHALGDEVEPAAPPVGIREAETGDHAIDEAGVGLLEGVVADTEPVQGAGTEVLDQHVGMRGEPAQDLLAVCGLKVEGDAPLVPVHHHEGSGFIGDLRWHRTARIISAGYLLDLDDVGAEVGQHEAAGRTCHVMGEVDDLEAGDRPLGVLGHIQRPSTIQRPLNCGVRFSMNARTPS